MVRLSLMVVAAASLTSLGIAQDVQNYTYTDAQGTTYRESRVKSARPVYETHTEARERTVYRRELKTEMQSSTCVQRVPVQAMKWRTRWVGRWNPLVKPYPVQTLVPCVEWQTRLQEVQTPVTRVTLVPEKRTEYVPVTTRRMEEREIISRVRLAGPPIPSTRRVASSAPLPSTRRVASSAPRAATNPVPVGGWANTSAKPRKAMGGLAR
ncbi:MAG: hypothetical protein N2C14_20555 [Planctomycetales bacterium]